jgi:hypothetical protein
LAFVTDCIERVNLFTCTRPGLCLYSNPNRYTSEVNLAADGTSRTMITVVLQSKFIKNARRLRFKQTSIFLIQIVEEQENTSFVMISSGDGVV